MKAKVRTKFQALISPVLVFAVAAVVAAAQEAVPDKPFKAVHLLNLPAEVTEGALLAGLADMNRAIAKAGCPDCGYHLYKVYGKQAGSYSYLWESTWPGRAVYEKIHKDPGYQEAGKRHPALEKASKEEIYNRFVEVLPAQK